MLTLPFQNSLHAGFVSQAAKIGIQGLPLCRTFSLEEIREATSNFHDSTIIGDGSYGKVTF